MSNTDQIMMRMLGKLVEISDTLKVISGQLQAIADDTTTLDAINDIQESLDDLKGTPGTSLDEVVSAITDLTGPRGATLDDLREAIADISVFGTTSLDDVRKAIVSLKK